MFIFQHSQITQKEFEQLTDILLKYPKITHHQNLVLEK